MNPHLQNAMAELAQKIGTSAEHIWPILIKQVIVSAWIQLFSTAIFSLLCFVISFLCFKKARREKGMFGNSELWYILTVHLILIGILSLIFAILAIPQIIYPETEAIKMILSKS